MWNMTWLIGMEKSSQMLGLRRGKIIVWSFHQPVCSLVSIHFREHKNKALCNKIFLHFFVNILGVIWCKFDMFKCKSCDILAILKFFKGHLALRYILTFISMINTTSESLKAREVFILQHVSFCEQLKFHAQLSWEYDKFYIIKISKNTTNVVSW